MNYCKHCGFAESLNQVWTWPMGCSSLLPVCTLNFTQHLGLLRNFETDVLVRFEIPLPPALSLLKIPSYQTATSSQIIGFSCCSSAAFSSDCICSDHFLAIFLIINRGHSATVYITTIQIIPSKWPTFPGETQSYLFPHFCQLHLSLPFESQAWPCYCTTADAWESQKPELENSQPVGKSFGLFLSVVGVPTDWAG